MEFENQLPEWKNEGTEPSDNLKTKGFTLKLKPPADIFNWFWSKVIKAIKELQSKLKGHAEDKNNPHGVTAAQVGAAESSHNHSVTTVFESDYTRYLRLAEATSSDDGRTYRAYADRYGEYADGKEITVIFTCTNSAVVPSLKVGDKNDAVPIYRAGSNGAYWEGLTQFFIKVGYPYKLRYATKLDGGGMWVIVDHQKPMANDLKGAVPLANGGTGAIDAAAARANLENNICSYTTLSQFGLSDNEMSSTDFMSNIDKIVTKLDGKAATLMLVIQSNVHPTLHASVVNKLNEDTEIEFNAASHAGWLSIHFSGEAYRPVVIEVNLETASYYDIVWRCVFNKGADGNKMSIFKEH